MLGAVLENINSSKVVINQDSDKSCKVEFNIKNEVRGSQKHLNTGLQQILTFEGKEENGS